MIWLNEVTKDSLCSHALPRAKYVLLYYMTVDSTILSSYQCTQHTCPRDVRVHNAWTSSINGLDPSTRTATALLTPGTSARRSRRNMALESNKERCTSQVYTRNLKLTTVTNEKLQPQKVMEKSSQGSYSCKNFSFNFVHFEQMNQINNTSNSHGSSWDAWQHTCWGKQLMLLSWGHLFSDCHKLDIAKKLVRPLQLFPDPPHNEVSAQTLRLAPGRVLLYTQINTNAQTHDCMAPALSFTWGWEQHAIHRCPSEKHQFHLLDLIQNNKSNSSQSAHHQWTVSSIIQTIDEMAVQSEHHESIVKRSGLCCTAKIW